MDIANDAGATTMQVIPYAEPPAKHVQSPELPLLMAGGTLLLSLGGLAAMPAILTILTLLERGFVAQNRADAIAPAIAFTMVAIGLIWTGLGSMKMRRWSRAVILSACAPLIAFGVVTLGVLVMVDFTLPSPFTTLEQTGGMTLRTIAAPTNSTSLAFTKVSVFTFCIALPLLFTFFYSSRRVIRALEEADDRITWTDRMPLPVLALSMALAAFAVVLFLTMFAIPPIPIGFARAETAEARVILGGGM